MPNPPAPVRPPTPTLDVFYAKYKQGARFFPSPPPAVGDRDFGIELYRLAKLTGKDDLGNPVAPDDLAAVSIDDVTHAQTYPVELMTWATTYNGGFPPGQGANEQTLTLDELAKKSEAQQAAVVAAPPEPVPPSSLYLKPAPAPTGLTDAQVAAAIAQWRASQAAQPPVPPPSWVQPPPVSPSAWPPIVAAPVRPPTRWSRFKAWLKTPIFSPKSHQ